MLLSLVVGEDVDVDGFSIFFREKKRTAKTNFLSNFFVSQENVARPTPSSHLVSARRL